MDKPIKVGSGVRRSDTWITFSVCIDKLEGHTFEYEGKRYVKLNANIFDAPNQYGKDVSISIDTYKPQSNEKTEQPQKTDDLPF